MLVDVVLMRKDGVKLPVADVRAAAPVRGRLRLRRARTSEGVEVEAQLLDPTKIYPAALAHLEFARVAVLERDTLIVVGLETVGGPADRQQQPQAWWCRLV